VLQSAGIDGELAVGEVLGLYAGCYPRPLPLARVIELVGLEEKRRARVKTLSGGQRRRLDLALALVADPDLIFLDEPTTGFDPAARRAAWRLVESLRGLGRTIVLTSHYMDEVQHLADRALVLAGGRIVAEGRPDSLGGATPHETVISFRFSDPDAVDRLPDDVHHLISAANGAVTLRTAEPTRVLLRLCGWAVERNVELQGLEVTQPSLEEVYLQLTEETADDGD
jgi:ABC-2 type transport system ATP-binding protein